METLKRNMHHIKNLALLIVIVVVANFGYDMYKKNVLVKKDNKFKTNIGLVYEEAVSKATDSLSKKVYSFPVTYEYDLDFKDYDKNWKGHITVDEDGQSYMAIYNNRVCAYKTKADTTYSFKETTYEECKSLGEPILYSLMLSETDPKEDDKFLGTVVRNKIETITFNDSKSVNPNRIAYFDVSESKDESVILYYMDADNNGLYEVFIGSEDGVLLNRNSEYLFQNLVNLTNIYTIKNLSTKSVTNMKNMFYNCPNLRELNLTFFDTSNVNNMSGMFYNLKGLNNLDLSSFKTNLVTDMSYMFYGVGRLKTLNLDNFNTSLVTNMESMFHNMSSLEYLDLTKFDTSNVTNMKYMFAHDNSLTKVILTSFNTSKVTEMTRMFFNCRSLLELDVSSFDVSNTSDLSFMFSGCSSLTELNLRSFDLRNAKNLEEMLSNCGLLKLVHIKIEFWEYEKGIDKNLKSRTPLRYKKYNK
jgi:surface protein